MTSEKDAARIRENHADGVIDVVGFRGETTIVVKPEALHAVLKQCRADLGYDMLLDISSIDHFGEELRFEMVYELATLNDSKHLRVRSKIDEDAEVPTITDIWAGADWHEREVWDMMGIRFSGHPNLKRILMWEGYPFFPLRKDFPLAGRPTDMPDVAFSDVAPLEGGPFVTSAGATNTVTREPRAQIVE